MIDINLLGKEQKTIPEITPTERAPAPPIKEEGPLQPGKAISLKFIFLLIIALVIVISFLLYGKDIINYSNNMWDTFWTTEEQEIGPQQPVKAESEAVRVPEPVSVPEPVPVTPVTWNYRRSIEHINMYTAFVRSLPPNVNYNILSVRRNSIISEIETENDTQMFDTETAIRRGLPVYSFNFIPKDRLLQAFSSTQKSDAELPEVTPSKEYATPDANRNAINSLLKQYKLTIKEQTEAAPTERENLMFIPVWIKFSGTEANILQFLNDIKEKGLSINITKISGLSKNRSKSNEVSELNFNFEIIM